MAGNRVFVSPGVYTSELDLSFIARQVGVTTLGVVGETPKGPAFEPVFISSYDEYQTIVFFLHDPPPVGQFNTRLMTLIDKEKRQSVEVFH